MTLPTKQELEDAKADIDDLEAIVNGDDTTVVETRLGGSKSSLSKYLKDIVAPTAATAIAALQNQQDAAVASIDAAVDEAAAEALAAVAALGWVAAGDFAGGFTLSSRNQYATYNGDAYKWAGALPKTVSAGATPASAGGLAAGAWVLLKLDAADQVSAGDVGTVQDYLDRQGATLLGPQLSQFTRGRVCRILYTGTSIEANSNSAWRLWVEGLKRAFGDSGNITLALAGLGGSYENPFNGWQKQPFPGFYKHRIRGNSASQALPLAGGSSRRIVLRYSTESDGGSFDLYVDGVFNQTVNCNGSQSFGNEVVLEWDELGFHTLELQPPASGYAYVESVDWCPDNPGIHLMDGAYGGSSIRDYVLTRGATGAQVAGIPVVGNNGLAAVFNNQSAHSKPDLIILPYTVNDAGGGLTSVNTYSIPAINQVVAWAKDSGTHVLLGVEMGGHYTLTASAYHSAYNAMRAAIRAHRLEPHVTLVDWHLLSGLADAVGNAARLEQLAYRYYSVSNLDAEAGTFSGDFIHPGNDGYAILGDALARLSGTQPPMVQGTGLDRDRPTDLDITAYGDAPPYAESKAGVVGLKHRAVNTVGALREYTSIGAARNMVTWQAEPLWFCAEELNYSNQLATLVATSADSDEYGRYYQFTNNSEYVYLPRENPDASAAATVTVILGPGTGALRLNNEANNAKMPVRLHGVDGVDGKFSQAGGIYLENNTDRPRAYHVTFNCSDRRAYLVLSGKVYGFYVTATAFACIPGARNYLQGRWLAPAMVATAGLTVEQVTPGQTYLEAVSGGEAEKVALAQPVVNSLSGAVETLYQLRDPGNFPGLREQMLLHGTLTQNAYDARLGAPSFSTNANPQYYKTAASFGAADAGKTLTIVGTWLNTAPSFKVWMFTGSANIYLGLNPDGSWVNTAFASLPNAIQDVDTRRGVPFFITFTLPDAALFQGYSNFQLRISSAEGLASSLPRNFTLCEGALPTL